MSVGINLSNIENLGKTEIVQIFTHDNKELTLKWSNNDLRNIIENTKKVYVHSIFKVVLGRPYTFKLFNDHFSYCCNYNLTGYIIHLPKLENKNIFSFIIKMFHLFSNMDTKYNGQIVYFEHIPSEYYCNPKNMVFFINKLYQLLQEVAINIKIGICIDTCHLYSAGYDLSSKEIAKRYFDTIKKINKNISVLIHLNDSKYEKESFRDHHAELGYKIWKNDQSGLKYILGLPYDKIIELKDCDSSLNYINNLIK